MFMKFCVISSRFALNKNTSECVGPLIQQDGFHQDHTTCSPSSSFLWHEVHAIYYKIIIVFIIVYIQTIIHLCFIIFFNVSHTSNIYIYIYIYD
jgi:hypothetical protein